MKQFKYISKSPQDTSLVASQLASLVQANIILVLQGDLGAGKTLFTKAFCLSLGTTEAITSPTFNLMNVYSSNKTIYHFDLYRLEDEAQLDDIGFYEYTDIEDEVVIIEWPDKFWECMPEDYILVRIDKDMEQEDYRVITIEAIGNKYAELVEELQQ